MKKTLLLAAALACSGVAQAEIFSCTSTYGAAITPDTVLNAPIPNQSWIADTTRGLRVPGENNVVKDYAGECEVTYRSETSLSAACLVTGLRLVDEAHTIKIDKLPSGIFFYASILNIASMAYAGTCTEI
jgi:hypothetical protein